MTKPNTQLSLKPSPEARYSTIEEVLSRIDKIDPKRYDQTRNYLDGAVTWLSPYITHGVINTQTVASRVLSKHPEKACYRLLFELAWREFFHRMWQERKEEIFCDLYNKQEHVETDSVPQAIVEASTGIHVLDEGLREVQQSGWMHNRLRMWVAGIVCNIAHTAWQNPARWLYYHLLDGDLASNTLSWQWIAGTSSNKQYIANQVNLNIYSRSNQHDTWLDVDYDTLARMATPEVLKLRVTSIDFDQEVPGEPVPGQFAGKIALRSLWNLNPDWMARDPDVTHILFIEQQQIEQWPMASHRWAFILHWVDQLGIDVWSGSVEDLARLEAGGAQFVREEYPACAHWPGAVTERSFHFGVPENDYRSFSQFWKQVK